jgi:transposase InsO family protein
MAPSTVYAVLCRAGESRLSRRDRVTRHVVRYERQHPGELLHVDVKKLGRIPDGGGWRATGPRDEGYRDTRARKLLRSGYDFVHIAIDDASRIAFAQVHPDEKATTCVRFISDALDHFAALGAPVQRLMTDNAWAYVHRLDLRELLAANGARHVRTRPWRPQTNGKVERFNRILLDEFAYATPYQSNQDRVDALPAWIAEYNRDRHHYGLGGLTPTQAFVNKLPGKNT